MVNKKRAGRIPRPFSSAARSANSGKTSGIDEGKLFSMIQKKAYEYYLQRGCSHGNDKADWLRAEREVKRSMGLR